MKTVNLKPLGNLLVKKEDLVDQEYNTEMNVGIGQIAVIYKNNQYYDTFYEGKKLINPMKKVKNPIDPSFYVIYVVNNSFIRSTNWGTKNPNEYNDQELGTSVMITSSGSYKYSIKEPKKFVNALMGHKDCLTESDFNLFFDDIIIKEVKQVISNELKQMSYLELDQKTIDMSNLISKTLLVELNRYGIALEGLIINCFKIKPEWVVEARRKLMFDKKVNSVTSEFRPVTFNTTSTAPTPAQATTPPTTPPPSTTASTTSNTNASNHSANPNNLSHVVNVNYGEGIK